jgi:hypothetical protein
MSNMNTVDFRTARAASNKKAREEAMKMEPQAWNATRRSTIPINTARRGLEIAQAFREAVQNKYDEDQHMNQADGSCVPSMDVLQREYDDAIRAGAPKETIKGILIQMMMTAQKHYDEYQHMNQADD